MHSVIHVDFAKASAQRGSTVRAVSQAHQRPPTPPNGVVAAVAHVLAVVASRLDRESARRAIA